MATYLADRVIVFDGKPSVDAHASEYVLRSPFPLSVDLFFSVRPQALVPGMNSFLKQLEITFRRDPENARPRINKKDSVKVTIRAVVRQRLPRALSSLGFGTEKCRELFLSRIILTSEVSLIIPITAR